MIQLPRICPPPCGPCRPRRLFPPPSAWLQHAAVIVTPVGVEILPFLRTQRTMQWFFWQQIRSADREGGRLNLRLTDGSTVAVSLRPMTAASRDMLAHAVRQRVNTLQSSGYGQA